MKLRPYLRRFSRKLWWRLVLRKSDRLCISFQNGAIATHAATYWPHFRLPVMLLTEAFGIWRHTWNPISNTRNITSRNLPTPLGTWRHTWWAGCRRSRTGAAGLGLRLVPRRICNTSCWSNQNINWWQERKIQDVQIMTLKHNCKSEQIEANSINYQLDALTIIYS